MSYIWKDKNPTNIYLDDNAVMTIVHPKQIADITICGALHINITDDMVDWVEPTPEQIKNLHDTFCIDVKLLKEK